MEGLRESETCWYCRRHITNEQGTFVDDEGADCCPESYWPAEDSPVAHVPEWVLDRVAPKAQS